MLGQVSEATPDTVLRLGDPRLRRKARPVRGPADRDYLRGLAPLHQALREFRAEHGFGRAISAPQIGVALRFVAVDLDRQPFTMINPEITWRSRERFTLWDACMSFPGLLVRVRRHRSISVRFDDDSGDRRVWKELDPATSELLQHEIDHLDGVLAVDRAVDRDSLVLREVYDADRPHFDGMVDRLATG